MEAKQAADKLTALFSGHSIVFGVAHFRFLSVSIKLVDRGRYEVLVVHLDGHADGLSGLEPCHSFMAFPVAYQAAY
jgi:hypothetical protein